MCAAANPWGVSTPAVASSSSSSTDFASSKSFSEVMSEQLADELNAKEMKKYERDLNADLKLDQLPPDADEEFKLPDESDGGCDNDLLIAQMLQMQFDKEYDQQLAREENHHNGTSKVNGNIVIFFVSLSMLYRSYH